MELSTITRISPPTVVAETDPGHLLADIINDACQEIGGIYRLSYDSAIVLSDDFRKHRAGGIPRGGFLLAAAGVDTGSGFELQDGEIILLRVRGTAPLPNEADLTETRLSVVRDATTAGSSFDSVLDPLTRDFLQQSAFDCEVVGTFYTDDDEDGSPIRFGADIDNVYVSARYQVFMPGTVALSWIASFSDDEGSSKDIVPIGTVRYTATRRKSVQSGLDQAQVNIHVGDFVGRKTAVLGMTRTGKSNTIKSLVTAVHRFGSENGKRIGQVIFDPQGEYASVNQQDKTALRLLGDNDSQVRIYKVNPDPADSIQKPLRFNFYDPTVIDAVWSIMRNAVADTGREYARSFASAEVAIPDPKAPFGGERARQERSLVAFYAVLSRCGFEAGTSGFTAFDLSLKTDMGNAFFAENPSSSMAEVRGGRYRISDPKDAELLASWIFKSQKEKDATKTEQLAGWFDSECHFKDIYGAIQNLGGMARLKEIRIFHSPSASGDVSQHVWNDMAAGRISIIDLSAGNDQVAKMMSERIVSNLLFHASKRFRDGSSPVGMQIVVEEAHNLFERNSNASVAESPWVRLSKEASKYQMGLVYATQEVTSVDKRILSNTSNWLISHLNSDVETRELEHYYDFSVWTPSLLKVEEKGFVRMKTYSGKYIVPVQISKFDHEMVNAARVAAGLAPIDLEEGV